MTQFDAKISMEKLDSNATTIKTKKEELDGSVDLSDVEEETQQNKTVQNPNVLSENDYMSPDDEIQAMP